MMGVVQSLNISVACAVSLFEAFRQRQNTGMYNTPGYSDTELKELERDWYSR